MAGIEDAIAREQVRQLRLAYAAHLDAQEPDKLAALFAEDAVCSFGSYGEWVGREQIRANYIDTMRQIGEPYDAIHVVTNDVIEMQGSDRAIGRWYLNDILTRQQPVTQMKTIGGHERPILWLARYEDVCRRNGDHWEFERVTLHFLWPER